MQLFFSLIIPVYNRPDEIRELLESCEKMNTAELNYEILIIEDGSLQNSEREVEKFENQLPLKYFVKENSGPGDSRNYGMQRALGNYFIILDSDVILPSDYLKNVSAYLSQNYVDCFGGADAANSNFTPIQKAVNFSMTSFLTTGGIRGKTKSVEKFKPRSFNMGISKAAFEATGGFAKIGVGEDLDLSIRIERKGFETIFIPTAKVYHKRRTSWKGFYKQVNKFGMGRPILNKWYPKSFGFVFWFPSLFLLGFVIALFLALFFYIYSLLSLYILYFLSIFVSSAYHNKDFKIGLMSVYATVIQFFGYGLGYLKSIYYIKIRGKKAEKAFPELFFD